MARFKLPGSSLLDRCIGRSTFQYTKAIQLSPFKHNLSYDSFIKTLSKYEPQNYSRLWTYTTPFGRQHTCRLNLGSSKRTICLHSDENDNKNDSASNIEVYEYCCGSIRNSLFIIQNSFILPQKIIEFLSHIQYKMTCYFAENYPHSVPDQFFDALYRGKLMDPKTFTSTQANFFPKWCSSISLVRVLKAKDNNINQLIEKLNENNKLKGQSKVNIAKDIDYEIEKEKKECNENEEIDEKYPKYEMKDTYQSDILRHYSELSKFNTNYECDEMYLVLTTRYALPSSSIVTKLLFLPHWISVKLFSNMRHENILKDIGNNLEFVAGKHNENEKESYWHKYRAKEKKKA